MREDSEIEHDIKVVERLVTRGYMWIATFIREPGTMPQYLKDEGVWGDCIDDAVAHRHQVTIWRALASTLEDNDDSGRPASDRVRIHFLPEMLDRLRAQKSMAETDGRLQVFAQEHPATGRGVPFPTLVRGPDPYLTPRCYGCRRVAVVELGAYCKGCSLVRIRT